MEKNKVHEIYEWIIVILLSLIIFSGDTVLSSYKEKFLIVLDLIVFLHFLIGKKQLNIKITHITVFWTIILIYLIFSVFYSIDLNTTKNLLLFYMLGISLLFVNFNQDLFMKLLKVFKIVSIVIAISIFIEFVIPNTFVTFFNHFFQSPANVLLETQSNYYSGLMGEKAYAAVSICIGICIIMYETFINRKRKKMSNIITVMILFLALLLTSKRMLTIIPIFTIIFLLILSNNKQKTLKILKILAIIAIFLIAIYFLFPSALNVISRFEEEGDNGRSEFIEYALQMHNENKLLGYGFGSFNEYIYNHGFRYYGSRWSFFTHNCYLEFLAELGAIGFLLITIAIIYSFKLSTDIYRKKRLQPKDKHLVCFSIGIQTLIIIYAITGNPFYYESQFILYIMSLCIINYIIRKDYKKNETQ